MIVGIMYLIWSIWVLLYEQIYIETKYQVKI